MLSFLGYFCSHFLYDRSFNRDYPSNNIPPFLLLLVPFPHFDIPPSIDFMMPTMGRGAAEATGLGFVCLLLSTLVCCQLILGFFVSYFIQFYPVLLPPPQALPPYLLTWTYKLTLRPRRSRRVNEAQGLLILVICD